MKVPKGQYNSFGKYKYRSCEDIVEAVKLMLPDGCILIITDDIQMIGDRFYVKATASLMYKDLHVSATAFAREALDKKGMDAAQITGAASSYARKYALNGLFAIDDTKDDDTDEMRKQREDAENKDKAEKLKKAKDWTNDFLNQASSITTKEDLDKLKHDNYATLKRVQDAYPSLNEQITKELLNLTLT